MTKREGKARLRAEVRALLDAGEPVPVQLMRLARSQGGLRGVTPRFMVLAHGTEFVCLREDGITLVRDLDEVHDMWRSSRVADDRVSATWAVGPVTAEDEAEWAERLARRAARYSAAESP